MSALAPKKHSQFILAAETKYFENHNDQGVRHFATDFRVGVTKFSLSKFIEEVISHLAIKQRSVLEEDKSYRQIIPYLIIKQLGKDGVVRYLAYKRGKGVGEKKLAEKISIGFGGHIDLMDIVHNSDSVINLAQTIHDAAFRERDEELRSDTATASFALGQIPIQSEDLIILLNHEVHAVHVGVVMSVTVPEDLEVLSNEDELLLLGFMTADDILHEISSDVGKLEDWSRFYLEYELRNNS
jgi:predicted NUDIX family phosphoesterase